MRLIALASGLASLLAACVLDFDQVGPHGEGGDRAGVGGDASSSSSGGGGSGGESGGAGGGGSGAGGAQVNDCSEGGGECVPVPAGFDGAIQLLHGASCAAGALLFSGGADFTAGPATCGCACEPASASCTLPAVATAFTGLGCTGIAVVFTPSSGCAGVPGFGAAKSVGLFQQPTPPGCLTNGAPANLPPVVFEDPAEGCTFQSLGCGADPCLPEGDGSYCFHRVLANDEVPTCPGDLVPSRLVRPEDLQDTRDCSCGCGPVVSAICGAAQWSLHGDGMCADQLSIESGNGCVESDLGQNILSAITTSSATVTCAQDTSASGSVDALGGLLLCCRPPAP